MKDSILVVAGSGADGIRRCSHFGVAEILLGVRCLQIAAFR